VRKVIIGLFVIAIMLVTIWWRAPIIGSEWSKQTIYVALLDAWYGGSSDDKAHAIWIDDDSTEGVFKVKKIADEAGILPCFAVIADRMTPAVADSLATWQRQGAGIVLHGFRHEKWWDWDETRIQKDIELSFQRLEEQGFDTTRIMRMVAPPHGCNNRTIRKVIRQQGFQTVDTDTAAMRRLLQKAYDRKAFVIFSSHSSIPPIFSEEKTRQVLRMAKEIGFDFEFNN